MRPSPTSIPWWDPDSHTPTANGISVLGWGVGGIEAEAAALGQPITLVVPRVIGVELTGKLPEGVTAMDLSLTFAQMLRKEGVVGCFVECFGPGVASLSATQRTCVSNMTPEYGSTCTLFPVDERTIEYLKVTGRSDEQAALVEAYAKAQGLWGGADQGDRTYAKVLKLDLGTVEHNIAGPSRPHDRIALSDARNAFLKVCADRNLDMNKTVRVDARRPAHHLAGRHRHRSRYELYHGNGPGHDAGRRHPCEERGRRRPVAEAVGEDDLRTGQPRRPS